ncbi:hypothetical protein Q8A73_007613 [Channa argus]|nr:hypothetical protein Q8A73_007613 [Channa argus]
MTTSSPVGSECSTLAQPISVPTLTVLPPSSDTESWSRSPSPRLSRFSRHGRSRSRTRTKKRHEENEGCTLKRGRAPQIVIEQTAEKCTIRQHSASPSHSVAIPVEGEEQGQVNPSQDLLLPPSRSWSHSPSPSRRSRWSLRSLLSRDSDWDSSSSAPPRYKKPRPHLTHGAAFSLLLLLLLLLLFFFPPSLHPVRRCKGDYGWTQRRQPVTGSCNRHRVQPCEPYLAARCRGVGHDGKLTIDRGTVDDGRTSTAKLSEGNEAEMRTYISGLR